MPSSIEVPKPRPSSSVVLVRQASAAPEIFMVKRHARSSFGAAYAFPGGVLESADRHVHAHCQGVTEGDADRKLQLDGGGLDYFSAAIRELFEESGVLLGKSRLSKDCLEMAREQLNGNSLKWNQFLSESDILLHCDQLHYFAFWITPVGLPKRYTTRFFLAVLPAGQRARHCGGELTDSCWMSAQHVLQASMNGDMLVHYPTRKILESIASFDSVRPLIDWASGCADAGVVCDAPARVHEQMS